MPGDHALLSASSASRWLNCTASARLTEHMEEETSVFAEEGSLAHEVAELTARTKFGGLPAKDMQAALKLLKKHELWDDEMIGHAETYRDYINEVALSHAKAPEKIWFERRVDYDKVAPEGFGTADCIMVSGGTMHIVDYKYGKGVPVSAEANSQLRLYALGAFYSYGMIWDITEVVVHVVQPRLNSTSSWGESLEQLLDWGENHVWPRALKAWSGEGEFQAGEHCRFCKANATCRARAEANLALAALEFKKPPLLSDQEIAGVLRQAGELARWATDVQEYALTAILEGKEIPGWKVVEGRANRKIEDVDRGFKLLIEQYEIPESLLYERKPVTLTTIEKIVPKDAFKAWAASEVVKPQGKPALVPETDNRRAFKLAQAAEEFKS